MRITVAAVGKLREKFWRDAVLEYAKRLGKYCTLSFVEIENAPGGRAGKMPDKAGAALSEQILKNEAQKILRRIPADAYVIALDIAGKSMDSEEFAGHLKTLTAGGVSQVLFIIGGALGLHQTVLKRSDLRLSFSALTFPHQLMRALLLEQIYRAFRINCDEPYHK